MGKVVFCYWNLRGLGAPVRNMLEYAGIEYEHKLAESREKWFEEKFTLGFDFPNLPYIIDGDARVSQSWAICKYIGRKVGLMPPEGDQYELQSDILEGMIRDFNVMFVKHCYDDKLFAVMTTTFLESLKQRLGRLEKYLTSRKFLHGDKLTYLDFPLFETLDHHRLFYTDIFSEYPNIDAYMKRFESLDRIKAFFQSDRYHPFPILWHTSNWGGKNYNDKN